MKRTTKQHWTAGLVLALSLALGAPANQATFPGRGGYAGIVWGGGFGSLWDEMQSLARVRWGFGPIATVHDAQRGTVKDAAASVTTASSSGGTSGAGTSSNATINPDGGGGTTP
jgi:hypothetical protein